MRHESPPNWALPPVAVALIAHTLWGSYQILSKLLLTRFDVPPLVFIASGQTIAAVIVGFMVRRQLRWSLMARPALIAVMLVAASRAITNILAVFYTLAIYVQLINLLAPFAVAILGQLLFREQPPPHTFMAALVAALGAALVIVGDPFDLRLDWGPTDGLGVGLAAVSVVTLALWTLLSRLNTHRHGLEPRTVFLFQASGVVVVSGITSLIVGQDWGIWTRLPLGGWALFALIVGSVMLVGNILQIAALSRLRAAFFSSMMGWRMVVALALGALLLGERLTSVWQVLGAATVVVTVTLYVRQRLDQPAPAQAGHAPGRSQ
jgi:drug/metabolite transporter (DMT)-like permease